MLSRAKQSRTLLLAMVAVLLLMQSASLVQAQQSTVIRYPYKYKKPCPERGHDFNKETGTFLCIVPKASDCFDACKEVGCPRWGYALPEVSAYDTVDRDNFRCRCLRRYGICSHMESRSQDRGYKGSSLVPD